MNVYFIAKGILDKINQSGENNLPILLNLLKVKQVIDIESIHTRDSELPLICRSMLVHTGKYVDIKMDRDDWIYNSENEIKRAVYKFIAPICKPVYERGKRIKDFQTHDLYQNSNAHNPIYNLEHCNDDNLLVYGGKRWDNPIYNLHNDRDGCEDIYFFIYYSLNILKKYTPMFRYENRICFIDFSHIYNRNDFERCYVQEFPLGVFMWKNGKFHPLRRFIQILPNSISGEYHKLDPNKSYSTKEIYELKKQGEKVYGKYYDPFISYIDIKLNELYPQERKELDFLEFFNYEGYLEKCFSEKIEEIEKEENAMLRYSYDDDLPGAEEIEYIRNNGGDWIDN